MFFYGYGDRMWHSDRNVFGDGGVYGCWVAVVVRVAVQVVGIRGDAATETVTTEGAVPGGVIETAVAVAAVTSVAAVASVASVVSVTVT